MTLEDYLKQAYEKGVIDHAVRAHHFNGKTTFYIHPARVGGTTADFDVSGNELTTVFVTGQ